MAEENKGLDLESFLGPVRAALDPDERKFFKAHLGEDGPGLMDYLMPTGRFTKAREEREFIRRAVLGEAIKYSQAPTVGDMQDQFPNAPIPTGAKQSMQVDRTLVPDTFDIDKLQPNTPMSQDMRLGIATQREASAGNPIAAAQMRDMPHLQGPAPTQVPDLGAGTRQLDFVNRDMKLPPSFQNLLGQMQHREGLKGTARTSGMTPTEENIMLDARYKEIKRGEPEAYPGELNNIGIRLGLHDKVPVPGSLPEKVAQAGLDKTVKETTQLIPSQVSKNEGDAAESNARATEINRLMELKADELISRTALQNTNAGAVGRRLENAEAEIRLQAAGKALGDLKNLMANEKLDPKSYRVIMESILRKVAPDLILSGDDPKWYEALFGLEPSGIKVEPRPGGAPAAPQTGIPKVEAPALTPPPQAAPPPADLKAEAEALYKSMKEGEVRTFKGEKYKRVGKGLQRVD